MGCGVVQSYGFSLVFPANGIGGHQKSWIIRVYGFPQRWVMTESTVITKDNCVATKPRTVARIMEQMEHMDLKRVKIME